jgi:two-component system cell cycle response regulator CpdR
MAHVLIVDDETDVLETLALIIEAAGHTVSTAKDGVAALDVLDGGNSLDLLLTDVVMPGLNGFNLARMARQRRSSLRVLYLTGFSEQAVSMRDPGDRYGKILTKPILPADLRREVNAALTAH